AGGLELADGAGQASDAAGRVVAVEHALADGLVECARGAPEGFLRGRQVLADDGLTNGANCMAEPGAQRLVARGALQRLAMALQRRGVVCHGRVGYHGPDGGSNLAHRAAFASSHRRSRSAASSCASERDAARAAASTWATRRARRLVAARRTISASRSRWRATLGSLRGRAARSPPAPP